MHVHGVLHIIYEKYQFKPRRPNVIAKEFMIVPPILPLENNTVNV